MLSTRTCIADKYGSVAAPCPTTGKKLQFAQARSVLGPLAPTHTVPMLGYIRIAYAITIANNKAGDCNIVSLTQV